MSSWCRYSRLLRGVQHQGKGGLVCSAQAIHHDHITKGASLQCKSVCWMRTLREALPTRNSHSAHVEMCHKGFGRTCLQDCQQGQRRVLQGIDEGAPAKSMTGTPLVFSTRPNLRHQTLDDTFMSLCPHVLAYFLSFSFSTLTKRAARPSGFVPLRMR